MNHLLRTKWTLVLAVCVSCLWMNVSAEIVMPVTFGDGMVLQREMPIRVFGQATDETSVTVELNGARQTTTVRDGEWLLTLTPMPAGGPYE